MIKIVRVPFDDILFDPEEVGEMLTRCQRRHRKMRFAGAGASDQVLFVLFEETACPSESRIVLAPFKNAGSDEISAEITERYEHGYTLRSSFRIQSRSWAVYEVLED